MPFHIVRLSIVLMGLLYIFIIPDTPLLMKLLFKIIPIMLIIYYAFIQAPENRNLTHIFIFIGLGFSMIADGSIIYSFIAGLIFFFIAHLFYIGAFIKQYHFSPLRTLSLVLLIIVSIFIGNSLIDGLQESGETALMIPVILYIAVIISMCWLAIMTSNLYATIGSILFVISDTILAWNKFVTPILYEEVLVMLTYYAAQFFIAHSLMTIVQKKERTT